MTNGNKGEAEYLEILEHAFGPHCGLNMDWANHAWLVHDVGGLGANRGRGIYVYADDGQQLLLLDVTFGAGGHDNKMTVLATVHNANVVEVVKLAKLAKTAQIENGGSHAKPEGRAALFTTLPDTQQAALDLMRRFKAAGLVWHLDDDPLDKGLADLGFTESEAVFIGQLTERLNTLFGAEAENPKATNAGAWFAAGLVNWGEYDGPVGEPAKPERTVEQIASDHGWEVTDTGGGCTALQKDFTWLGECLITEIENPEAPKDANAECVLSFYNKEGDIVVQLRCANLADAMQTADKWKS